MPSEAGDAYEQKHISGAWYRLIPSRFPTIDIYRRVAPPERWALAMELEGRTNPRVRLRDKTVEGALPSPGSPHALQNWNHAPFVYRDPQGSWWLSGVEGVLELAEDVQGALARAIRRREQFLEATSTPPIDLEMRLLKHEVDGRFHDLTKLPLEMPQADRWKIGKDLLDKGASGIIFRCPERSCTRALAVFDNGSLKRALQTRHFKFRWDGARITQIYDFRDSSTGEPLLAEHIFASEEVSDLR